MLYDKRWETQIEPIEEWRQVLLDAANLIEINGWCQRQFSEGMAFCAFGAILKVSRQRRQPPHTAAAKLEVRLGGSDLVTWNDHPSRTEDEVIAKMREVARTP